MFAKHWAGDSHCFIKQIRRLANDSDAHGASRSMGAFKAYCLGLGGVHVIGCAMVDHHQ